MHNWEIDEDGWYTRPRCQGDPDIIDQPEFGFTMDDAVYVRAPNQCELYDKGIVEGEPQE